MDTAHAEMESSFVTASNSSVINTSRMTQSLDSDTVSMDVQTSESPTPPDHEQPITGALIPTTVQILSPKEDTQIVPDVKGNIPSPKSPSSSKHSGVKLKVKAFAGMKLPQQYRHIDAHKAMQPGLIKNTTSHEGNQSLYRGEEPLPSRNSPVSLKVDKDETVTIELKEDNYNATRDLSTAMPRPLTLGAESEISNSSLSEDHMEIDTTRSDTSDATSTKEIMEIDGTAAKYVSNEMTAVITAANIDIPKDLSTTFSQTLMEKVANLQTNKSPEGREANSSASVLQLDTGEISITERGPVKATFTSSISLPIETEVVVMSDSNSATSAANNQESTAKNTNVMTQGQSVPDINNSGISTTVLPIVITPQASTLMSLKLTNSAGIMSTTTTMPSLPTSVLGSSISMMLKDEAVLPLPAAAAASLPSAYLPARHSSMPMLNAALQTPKLSVATQKVAPIRGVATTIPNSPASDSKGVLMTQASSKDTTLLMRTVDKQPVMHTASLPVSSVVPLSSVELNSTKVAKGPVHTKKIEIEETRSQNRPKTIRTLIEEKQASRSAPHNTTVRSLDRQDSGVASMDTHVEMSFEDDKKLLKNIPFKAEQHLSGLTDGLKREKKPAKRPPGLEAWGDMPAAPTGGLTIPQPKIEGSATNNQSLDEESDPTTPSTVSSVNSQCSLDYEVFKFMDKYGFHGQRKKKKVPTATLC